MREVTRYKDRPLAHEMQDVSVDIETLSHEDNAVVISIGVATHDGGATFYEHFNLEQQMEWKRHVQLETMEWHMQEHPKMYARDIA